MKTTQQKRAERIKQMEGSRITREYMIHACKTDAGDLEMALRDKMDDLFAKALMRVLKIYKSAYYYNRLPDLDAALDCLNKATQDIIERQAAKFPTEEELEENEDE